jgi:hypothetical protein
MKHIVKLVLAAAVLSNCKPPENTAKATASANPIIDPATKLPIGAHRIPAGKEADLLSQCSRNTPPKGSSYWVPEPADIVALESGLAAELKNFENPSMVAGTSGNAKPQSARAIALRQKIDTVYKGYDAASPAEQARMETAVDQLVWNFDQDRTAEEKRANGFAAGALNIKDVPNSFVRHYIGIIRDGRRFVYGNFAPDYEHDRPPVDQPQILLELAMVCDGGPQYFGVEYEPATQKYTHVAFNGGG